MEVQGDTWERTWACCGCRGPDGLWAGLVTLRDLFHICSWGPTMAQGCLSSKAQAGQRSLKDLMKKSSICRGGCGAAVHAGTLPGV